MEEKSESGDFDLIKIVKELSDKHLKIQKELSRLEAKAEILSQIEEKRKKEFLAMVNWSD